MVLSWYVLTYGELDVACGINQIASTRTNKRKQTQTNANKRKQFYRKGTGYGIGKGGNDIKGWVMGYRGMGKEGNDKEMGYGIQGDGEGRE